jgi:hypothetical protein
LASLIHFRNSTLLENLRDKSRRYSRAYLNVYA